MKKLKIIMALAIALIIVVLSSCQEKVTSTNLVIDETTKGTIKVTFYAELDAQTLGLEKVPSGTVVTITAPLNAINPAAPDGEKWITSATVGSDGSINVSVPTRSTGVTFTIIPNEFTYNTKVEWAMPVDNMLQIYSYPSFTLNVYPGQTKLEEKTYNSQPANNNVVTVNRKFKGEIFNDLTTYETTVIPNGTSIRVYNDEWFSTTTVGQNGLFSVDVPYNQNFFIQFETQVKESASPDVYKNYRYQVNKGPYTETSPAALTIQKLSWAMEVWE